MINYDTFDDVKDRGLRIHNRATVMANILEDYAGTGGEAITIEGADLLVKYLKNIPSEERDEVFDMYCRILNKRGFIGIGGA